MSAGTYRTALIPQGQTVASFALTAQQPSAVRLALAVTGVPGDTHFMGQAVPNGAVWMKHHTTLVVNYEGLI